MATAELVALCEAINTELDDRRHDVDWDGIESAEVVDRKYVEWTALSAAPNLNHVHPMALRITGTDGQSDVDGTWLDTQRIDGTYHVDIAGLVEGDIIVVSGADHGERKDRYYRVLAITGTTLYYGPEDGLDKAVVIDDVA